MRSRYPQTYPASKQPFTAVQPSLEIVALAFRLIHRDQQALAGDYFPQIVENSSSTGTGFDQVVHEDLLIRVPLRAAR